MSKENRYAVFSRVFMERYGSTYHDCGSTGCAITHALTYYMRMSNAVDFLLAMKDSNPDREEELHALFAKMDKRGGDLP